MSAPRTAGPATADAVHPAAAPGAAAERTGVLALPLLVGGVFAFLSTRFAVQDSDVFWQLATARDLLARGFGRGDAFSWTVAGAPLASDQWLGQLLFYGAWVVGSWQGVVALRALAVGALVALVVVAALDARRDRPLAAVLAALPAILLSRFVWAERPELLGFACFALLVVLLRRGRRGSRRALVATVPLIALWANLHGSFALGVVLTGIVCAEGWWSDRARRRVYLAVALAAFVASLATPAGVGGWAAPGFHLTQPPREIQEWAAVDVRSLPGLLYAVALAATLALAFVSLRAPLAEAALLLPVVFLSLTAARQTPYLAIAAAPFIAARLPGPRLPPSPPAGPRAALAGGLLALALLAGGVAPAPAEPDLAGFPAGALAALPEGPGLFAQYDWGGFLIWYAPRTPVFVDGRLVPYLGVTLGEYRTVLAAAPGWREVLARRGVRWLLVRPADPVAVRAIDLGWTLRSRAEDYLLIGVP